MTIDEAKEIANTTKSYALKRDMLKFIKRKEREKWLQTKLRKTANAGPRQ